MNILLIHQHFLGGNISIKDISGDTIVLENELRDTKGDWFYWAFCVEGAENRTLTFQFQDNRLGYYGPAVSYDLENWHWLDCVEGDTFSYSFTEDEHKVYFAHHMLYHPARFFRFAQAHHLCVEELCKGYKGSSIPSVTIGDGPMSIILTARHHACESTGNYVLEGALEELLACPIPHTTVFCVPFVDYEGVLRGDQGKARLPFDHNRDYDSESDSIYPECRAIKAYADKNGCHFGIDFHSPWHIGDVNDHVFIVQNSIPKLPRFNQFGELLQSLMTPDALQYEHQYDYPPETGWNKSSTQFSVYMSKKEHNHLAFTIETTYFGTHENKVSQSNLIALGRCVARALRRTLSEASVSIPQ
ncbi:MAG: hypothetical protein J6R42_03270 [Clostridia bacterium]|nr:hypothetical protein [Clostridia bacterium]